MWNRQRYIVDDGKLIMQQIFMLIPKNWREILLAKLHSHNSSMGDGSNLALLAQSNHPEISPAAGKLGVKRGFRPNYILFFSFFQYHSSRWDKKEFSKQKFYAFSSFRASNSNIVFTIPRWIQIISANDLKSSFCSVSEGSWEALSRQRSHSYSLFKFFRIIL